jgi:hypothetical protein
LSKKRKQRRDLLAERVEIRRGKWLDEIQKNKDFALSK